MPSLGPYPRHRIATAATILFIAGMGALRPADASTLMPGWSSPLTKDALTVAVGDLNNDGKPDLVVGSFGNSPDVPAGLLNVYLGKGDGAFDPLGELAAGSGLTSLALADLNGDGKLDVITGNAPPNAAGSVGIYLGKGDGTFLPRRDELVDQPWKKVRAVVTGDVNGDGKPDLVGLGDNFLFVRFNKGDGTLLPETDLPNEENSEPRGFDRGLALADLNGDGKLDIITQYYAGIRVLSGKGDGTFQAGVKYPTTSQLPPFVRIADLNGDGRPDVVTSITQPPDNTLLNVFLGQGNGALSPELSSYLGEMPLDAAPADFDGDGHTDLAVLYQSQDAELGLNVQSLGLLIGKGDGRFRLHAVGPGDRFTSALATGDFNGDGKPDLVTVTAGFEGRAQVWLNTPETAAQASWGRIANPERQGRNIISAIYFAGPPNPNSLPLYTRHPQDTALNGWTDADIDVALRQMTAVGLNTIKLSYWGYQGEADKWSPSWLFSQKRWPGDSGKGNYTEAEQVAKARHFYEKAASHGLLIAPMIEVSPAFPLDERFNEMIDPLIERCSWLLQNLGDEPNWLRVYDQDGQTRKVIWLIESVQLNAGYPLAFSKAFTTAAEKLKAQFGTSVGFILDPISFYSYAAFGGPEPAVLIRNPNVLAINPYNATAQGVKPYANLKAIPEEERQAYAESVFQRWSDAGIPFIAPIMPGYDAHKVFPTEPIYGFTPGWRDRQKELAVEYATSGLSMDTWNGWTEGYAIPPSVEEGDASYQWAADVVSRMNREGKAQSVLPGDVDGDGTVRLADVILLLHWVIGAYSPTSVQVLAGDLQPTNAAGAGDGRLDLRDVTALLRRVVGL